MYLIEANYASINAFTLSRFPRREGQRAVPPCCKRNSESPRGPAGPGRREAASEGTARAPAKVQPLRWPGCCGYLTMIRPGF